MSALEPGLCRATVNYVADRTVLVDSTGWGYYIGADGKMLANHHHDHITDARPLIVLDMMGMNPTPILTGFLREQGYDWLASQIEAQTKPARIPEPGLWGVVEAGCVHSDERGSWVHDPLGWARVGHEQIKTYNHDGWADLIDPTLVREGVTP